MGGEDVFRSGTFSEDTFGEFEFAHMRSSSDYTSRSRTVEDEVVDGFNEAGDDNRSQFQYFRTTSVSPHFFSTSRTVQEHAEARQSEIVERNASLFNMQSGFSNATSESRVTEKKTGAEALTYDGYAEGTSGIFEEQNPSQEDTEATQFETIEEDFSSSHIQLGFSNATSESRVLEREVVAETRNYNGCTEETSIISQAQDISSDLLSTSRFAQEISEADGAQSSEQSAISPHTGFHLNNNGTEERNGTADYTDGHSDMMVHAQTNSSGLIFTESLESVRTAAEDDIAPPQTTTPDFTLWETRTNGTTGNLSISERRKRTFIISHAEPVSSSLTITSEVEEQETESETADSRKAREERTSTTAGQLDQSVSISPETVAGDRVTSENETLQEAVGEGPVLCHTEPASSSEMVHMIEEKEVGYEAYHRDKEVVDDGNSIPKAQSIPSERSPMQDQKDDKTSTHTGARALLVPSEELHLTKLAKERDIARISQLAHVSPGEPYLNPESRDFDLYRWLRPMMYMLNQGKIKGNIGMSFRNLHVLGTRPNVHRQLTILGVFSSLLRPRETFSLDRKSPKNIIRNLNGVINNGELLLVLGQPGAGCSTVAKSLCGELQGLKLGSESLVHYSGIRHQQRPNNVKREMLYNSRTDKHFPHLTVGQTLEFAASVRAPTESLQGITRTEYAEAMTKVVIAVFGLSHTYSTRIKDVTESERKRVSIAEIILSGAALAAWDKPTQGLASTEALKFVQSLRLAADLGSSSHVVAAYEASEAIYDLFDKVLLLYEGRQIFYGSSSEAKGFFERQGWYCHPQQSTAEFLTSVTNLTERQPCRGMEDRVPRAPEGFESHWYQSPEYQELQKEISEHKQIAMSHFKKQLSGPNLNVQQNQSVQTQSNWKYPSVILQVKLTIIRAFQRAWNERVWGTYRLVFNLIIALLIGSMFYNTPATTARFFSKGAVLFYLVFLNSLLPLTELSSQIFQRPVVEKHTSFGFYHPMAESLALLLSDIPINFLLVLVNTIVIYFMSNLRREPSQFFICLLINFVLIHVTSAAFRMTAAVSKTLAHAQVLAGTLVLWVVIYTGFVIPEPRMPHWFKFVRYINPIYYAYEALIANEFHGREFGCADFVPSHPNLQGDAYICSAVGAVAGRRTVSGDDYIWQTYRFTYDHVWRNFGLLIVFLVGWMTLYFLATQFVSYSTTQVESLRFLSGSDSARLKHKESHKEDEESGKASLTPDQDTTVTMRRNEFAFTEPQQNDLSWRDVTYDLSTGGANHRILDQVTGWAKPGTITALMSLNSAQKTDLLKVLAQRTTIGTVSGDILFNNCLLSSNLQRKIGYVQHHDLHLETATVRETLRFSAMLRQPGFVHKGGKYTHVEQIIKALDMEDYADAIVGAVGEGLNTKQRRLLSIGVELAAMPEVLFVEEPVGGLDVQSSRAIYHILKRLADAGQTIICTLQPSMMAFKQVDQLLFLSSEGKTIYFGPTGENAQPLLDYLKSNGAPRSRREDEDAAEYIVGILSTASNKHGEAWSDVWSKNNEVNPVHEEFESIRALNNNPTDDKEFAIPLLRQFPIVLRRTLQQYWRSPLYILSRILLQISAAIIIGFSFYKHGTSINGLQETIFSSFMICTLFAPLVHQTTPLLNKYHTIYESRERLSKTYSGKVLLLSIILVELLYQIILSIRVWASYYYPISGTTQSPPRQGLILLLFIQFFIYAISFALLAIPTSTLIIGTCSFMALTFNGIMQPPHALPGFWMFMYRVSPFTYFVSGVTSTQLHGVTVNCSSVEMSVFNPPSGQSCIEYLGDYLRTVPGRLMNPDAIRDCEYCAYSVADQFLAEREYRFDRRWMDFGVGWAFVGFNLVVAGLVYYVYWGRRWRPGFWLKVVSMGRRVRG
ncbi:hypothetical protein ASPBRDRAFT_119373 [Aspergillus brasiliensis CBS 101740]|uniref:ABC transporter domain-containing protein n=1 Tax=Aspergillus brasiliensis (strain CBS 101740 / IMI 381727 / IBT 21946) TaxID=767769 RepID=A0A1L9USF5_ASPBC|nr:hypothetical protein ASPBRDRAFT_119373 [Aspergillus brasiliensis CBS 101740]